MKLQSSCGNDYIATLTFMYPMDYFIAYFGRLFLSLSAESYTNIYLSNLKEFWHRISYFLLVYCLS